MVADTLPVARSQNFNVLSGEPDAMVLPSGEYVAVMTQSVWLRNVLDLKPLSAATTITVRSSIPMAMDRLSGEKETDRILAVCCFSNLFFLVRRFQTMSLPAEDELASKNPLGAIDSDDI